MVSSIHRKDHRNDTSSETASIRRAVGVDVLKVDLLPKEVVSAHCEAEERGRPRTSRLGGIHFVGDNHDHEGPLQKGQCSSLQVVVKRMRRGRVMRWRWQ